MKKVALVILDGWGHGKKEKAIKVTSLSQVFKSLKNVTTIGIDEAQFFDEGIVDAAKAIASDGKRIVIAGLEKDYLAVPFGPMPQLLIEAEYITKVSAICMKCGDPAIFSQRITDETSQILVGESDKYEARCRNCFKPN